MAQCDVDINRSNYVRLAGERYDAEKKIVSNVQAIKQMEDENIKLRERIKQIQVEMNALSG